MTTYELDLFITIPMTALPDKVRVFAGTLTVTPTQTILTWFEDDEECTEFFPGPTGSQRFLDWVYAHLTAA